jgi:outer membrane protein TolC
MTRLVVATVVALTLQVPAAEAQVTAYPSPALSLRDVVRLAAERRAEVEAARARVRAGEARPTIVGALEDPMLSPAIDHLPFMLDGADVSVTIEQRIPLSGLRGHRRASALADIDRLRAESARTVLDVGLEAASAFLMLQERRRNAQLLNEQLAFARDVVTAANARYAGGTAPQSDVLRAEVEVARLSAFIAALAWDVRAGEAMLNASLGLDADTTVPSLVPIDLDRPLATWSDVKGQLASRPELAAGAAEIARAEADVQVMRDMYRPMATIRTGPAYTMAEGRGVMVMVGVSLPIWRSRLRAGVAEAEAMKAMSEADLEAMRRMIEGQAASALNELRAARDRQRAIRDDVVPRARNAIDPALAGYSTGRLPLVSVVEAVQALWAVQADLITAEIQVGFASVRLGRAMGTYEGVAP